MTAGPPADIAAARRDLPACDAGRPVYMNIGGAGPMPRAAGRAVAEAMDRGMAEGRGSLPAVARAESLAGRVRAAAAALVGGRDDEVALTGNTTDGINIALWGIDWRAGDEIVTTALEHPGVSVPVGVIAARYGVRVHHIPAGEAHDALEAAVARRCGPRTRAVVLSHVAYGTGALLDAAGAEGGRVDAYAFPAHKWLYGPEGLGALWIRPDALERIRLSFSGYESGTGHAPDGGLRPHPGARRHEASTPPTALLGGWLAAIEWLEAIGWDRVFSRIAAGRAAAADALTAIPGVRVLTPDGPRAGLVTFAIDGADPVRAAATVARHGVVVRWLEHPPALRASIGFHWSEGDIAALRDAVRAAAGC